MHIARHEVTPDEVEDICNASPLAQEGSDGRLVVSGKTTAGRLLVVILAPSQDTAVFNLITAYPASGTYRRIYEQEYGKEDAA